MWCRLGAAELHLPPSSFLFEFPDSQKPGDNVSAPACVSGHKDGRISITYTDTELIFSRIQAETHYIRYDHGKIAHETLDGL